MQPDPKLNSDETIIHTAAAMKATVQFRETFFSKKRTVPLNSKKPLRKEALKSILNNMVDFSDKYIKTASGPIRKYTIQDAAQYPR